MDQKRQRAIAAAQHAAPRNRVLSFVVTDDEMLSPTAETASLLKAELLQDHECSSCGTRITAAATPGVQPFCVCCGSEKVTAAGKPYSREVASSDTELAAFQCSNSDCKTTTIMHAKVLAAADDEAFCPSCGTPMHVHASAADIHVDDDANEDTIKIKPEMGDTPPKLKKALASDEADDADDAEADDSDSDDGDDGHKPAADSDEKKSEKSSVWPFAQKASKQKASDFIEDESDFSLDALEENVLVDDVMTDTAPSLEVSDDFLAVDADPMLDSASDGVSFDDAFGGSTQDLQPMGDGDQFMDMPFDAGVEERIVPQNDLQLADADLPAVETEGDDMLDAVDIDDSVKACFFVPQGERLVAMKGQYSVGVLTKASAGANASIMHTDGFISVVSQTIAKEGLRKALASFGFKPVRVKVASTKLLKTKVQAAVKTIKQNAAAAEKAQADSFALASVGLARGFWKNQENPLRDAISRQFASLGVQNPDRLAARVLAEAGPGYSHTLCSVATQLAAMSPETRKEFASALDMVDDTSAAENEVMQDGVDVGDAPEAFLDDSTQVASSRLSVPARATASYPQQRTCALLRPASSAQRASSTGDDLADRMLSGSVPLFNFN